MAIFSRRILQRLINENIIILFPGQTKRHVDRLNSGWAKERLSDEDIKERLSAEWEVVLINALSKIGNVVHEKEFNKNDKQDNKKSDIYFESLGNPQNSFLVDITAVSDQGLHRNNPIEYLRSELYNKIKNHGLNPNKFSIMVNWKKPPLYKGSGKIELKLPAKARFDQIIFNDNFFNSLQIISKEPETPLRFTHFKTDDADMIIRYNPNQKYASWSYPSYQEIYKLTENRIFDALNDKLPQLTRTGFPGPLGICLCDAGCDAFNKEANWYTYSIDQVIKRFLSDNEEISFVITFSAARNSPLMHLYRGLKFEEIGFNLCKIIKQVYEVLPKPESDPLNVRNFLRGKNSNSGKIWRGWELSYETKSTKIKISARTLLELLSGRIDPKDIFERHENPFNFALTKGQLIERVIVEKSDSEDDDRIVFELSDTDPAISKFINPVSY